MGVVACSGGAVRAVERGRALGGARLPQGPRVLCPLPQGPRPSPHLLCGADDGTLHLLQLDRLVVLSDVINYDYVLFLLPHFILMLSTSLRWHCPVYCTTSYLSGFLSILSSCLGPFNSTLDICFQKLSPIPFCVGIQQFLLIWCLFAKPHVFWS